MRKNCRVREVTKTQTSLGMNLTFPYDASAPIVHCSPVRNVNVTSSGPFG